MLKITYKNIQSFCRICLDELVEKSVLFGEKYNIYESEDIEKLIALCSPQTIVEDPDDLPQFICSDCNIKLEAFHEFRCKALQSFNFLANILKDYDDKSGDNIVLLANSQGSEEQLENSAQTSKMEFQSPTRSGEKLQSSIENVVKVMQEPSSIKSVKEMFKNEIFVGEEVEIDIKDIKTDDHKRSDCEDSMDVFKFLKTDLGTHDEDDRVENGDISVQALEIHASSQNKIKKSTKASKRLMKSNTKEKTSDAGGSRFHCQECSRRFATKENFEAHLRTHQGLKPYVCKECNRDFNRVDHFHAHMREVHAAVKLQFVCSFEGCGKIFTRRNTCRAHYRQKHSLLHTKYKPKTYVCEYCGSTFKNGNTFKKHCHIHAPVEDPESAEYREGAKPAFLTFLAENFRFV
ncbi:zinc finger protein 195-like isoform X2 [Ceratitis capitata]|uniref:zinc finger protein 195-like isoform X2 n=1 Tax=Ceratitis capitata TaxID=7213 RepID=UPI00032A201A|nr:zinc finger protein 195-like isoform X2 [Ceratitis capitata]